MIRRCAIIIGVFLAVSSCTIEKNEPIGAACDEKEDCKSGLCLQEERWGESTGWADGYCTEECSGGCGRDAKCIELGDASYCMESCDEDTDCRSGYLCHPELSVCLPDCREGWDCGDDYFCDGGICLPDSDGQADGEMGDSCKENDDCRSGYCLPESLGWIDGMCSTESKDCPDGFESALIDEYDMCLPVCDDSGDCRDVYLCNPLVNLCLPDCRLGWDCGDSYECGENGFCS